MLKKRRVFQELKENHGNSNSVKPSTIMSILTQEERKTVKLIRNNNVLKDTTLLYIRN